MAGDAANRAVKMVTILTKSPYFPYLTKVLPEEGPGQPARVQLKCYPETEQMPYARPEGVYLW